MLKDDTIKLLNNKAERELRVLKGRGYDAEIVNVPIVIKRNSNGDVCGFLTFDNIIIPNENK